MILNPNPVVVAVGHDPIDSALGYAAEEAQRAGCGLHLVHVVHIAVQGPEQVLVEAANVEGVGKQTVEGALEHARDIVGDDTPITTELVVGPVVSSLVAACADARMIVLQHRAIGRLRRVVTRSVAGGVAARTSVPVVSVPSDWTPRPTHTWVTVGVDEPARSSDVLSAGLAAAQGRATGLRVVHAFDFPSAYDDFVMAPTELGWAERARSEIHGRLAALGGHADLPVEVVVERAAAAEAILRASEDSALVVVGRHDPLLPVGSHLGPVSRAVLRDARCPVLLAHPEASAWRRKDG